MRTVEEQIVVVEERLRKVALRRFVLLRGFRLRRLAVWREALEKFRFEGK